MADADRDSDLGDDSPVSARSEGESSGDQSCESSDEGVGRDTSRPHQPRQPHQHQPHQNHQPQHKMNHLSTVNHQQINNHSMNQQRNSPRPLERELKVRDDFESLKTSLHPHLSSLASLAQGAPLSTPSSVFALAGGGTTGGFPYAPPAFLAPAPPPPAQPVGSASSSSSEGSAAGWSFEEQYKQVRQLYELTDDPQRKEFLDDLFSFMQKRGTPITRLPIMAKSVLDLYELYNLVIARGGLVEVINKKLWQEIIKGLRLPSSITSAAFTLRTQYMKYLYDYECDKKNLSTRGELDAAIEGNKREGRRSSGQYEAQAAMNMPLSRGVPVPLSQYSQHMPPLPLSLGGVQGVPRLPPHPPHISQQELEFRVREYVKVMQKQHRDIIMNGTGPESPPNSASFAMMTSPSAALNAMDMGRMALWSLYNNNTLAAQPDIEPQREALNLSESPNLMNGGIKREGSPLSSPPKRRPPQPSPSPRALSPRSPRAAPHPPAPVAGPSHPTSPPATNGNSNGFNGAAFKIVTKDDVSTGGQQLLVSVDINGVTYEGVLYATQNDPNHNSIIS